MMGLMRRDACCHGVNRGADVARGPGDAGAAICRSRTGARIEYRQLQGLAQPCPAMLTDPLLRSSCRPPSIVTMTASPGGDAIVEQIRGAVTAYDRDRDLGALLDRLKAVAATADPS